MLEDFLNVLLPQACLCFFAFILLIFACLSPRFYKFAKWISMIGIIFTAFLLLYTLNAPEYIGFYNSILSNQYTQAMSFVILVCGFFVILLNKNVSEQQKQNTHTIHALLLLALLGAITMVSANDFLTLFISVELLSFSTYFLITTKKGYYSKEASFKYLITNAVATGVFLFGTSYLYGITSSINFTEIKNFIPNDKQLFLYSISTVFIFMGLISKLGIYPFANWIIDVYKGTESSILAFLSTIPELAIFGIIFRLFEIFLCKLPNTTAVLIFLSVLTAIWANIYAIREKNIKTIFACSSSANSSYIMLVACIVSTYNFSASIFYLICYVFLNITVFGFLNITETNQISLNIEDYKGLFYKNYLTTITYLIAIIALAGIPITSGFISKIYLFSGLVQSGIKFYPILIAILLLTILALYYYLKIIYPLFEKSNYPKKLKSTSSQKFVLVSCTIITILLGLYPNTLIRLCNLIVKYL